MFEFRWAVKRQAGAAAENVLEMGPKISFLKKCLIGTMVKFFYIALKYSPKVPGGPEKISASGRFLEVWPGQNLFLTRCASGFALAI